MNHFLNNMSNLWVKSLITGMSYVSIRRGCLIFSLCLCSLYLVILIFASNVYEGTVNSVITEKPYIIHWKRVKSNLNCLYSIKDDALQSAEDLDVNLGNNSIFFIETSCRGGINSRIACAVESAARLHPNRQVNLLFISPITEQMLKNSSLLKLSEFGNVKLLRIHIKEYGRGTVVENIMSNSLKRSKHPVEHASDIIRIITLYKFGGVYLDTDSILIRSLDSLPLNWIAKESALAVSAGIIALSKDAVGRNLTTEILTELHRKFKPNAWSENGPKAIQRVLKRLCPKTLFKADHCGGVKIFPPKYFYPIHYKKHRNYVKNGSIANMFDSYMHHMWNHFTENMKIEKKSPYAKLAKQFCPTIYEMYGDEFGE